MRLRFELSDKLKFVLQRPGGDRVIMFLSGLPGTGKTTVAELLTARLNARFIPEFLDPIPDWIETTRVNSSEEEKIQAQAWALDQHARKNLLVSQAAWPHVVVDRTWVDAVLYAAAYGQATYKSIQDMAEKIEWIGGSYVMLVARPETIRERLVRRGAISESVWADTWFGFVQTLREAANTIALGTKLRLMDTTDVSAAEVCEWILEHSQHDDSL